MAIGEAWRRHVPACNRRAAMPRAAFTGHAIEPAGAQTTWHQTESILTMVSVGECRARASDPRPCLKLPSLAALCAVPHH